MNNILDLEQMAVLDAVRKSGSRVFVEGGPGTGKTTVGLAAACEVLGASASDKHTRGLFVAFSRSAVAQIASNLTHVHATIKERIETATLDGLALRTISGFGRFHGLGTMRPHVQSAASTKIFGVDRSKYQYKRLVPLAVSMLKQNPSLLTLVKSRWCIVVCDEVQDITKAQLEFVELLCGHRLLLLGDRDQHIYGWRGADVKLFDDARSGCDQVFNLGDGSYRDPSLVFPKLASALRSGRPINQEVSTLVNLDRLRIVQVEDDIVEESAGNIGVSESSSSSVAIFAHHIETVATLGDLLRATCTSYEIAGTSEAYAEALEAMLTLLFLGLGRKTIEDAGSAFASVCMALHRGQKVPHICRRLLAAGDSDSDARKYYVNIKEELTKKAGGRLSDAVQLITQCWRSLNLGLAAYQWDLAAREFRRCAAFFTDEEYADDTVDALETVVASSRNRNLLDTQLGGESRITLMTYNQSKGREFDVVIHAHKSDDYWGKPTERDRKESLRVLGVAISRARQKLIVVTPHTPHEIVRPFVV